MKKPILFGRPSHGGLCLALLLALTSSVQAAPPDFTAPGVIAGIDRSNTFNSTAPMGAHQTFCKKIQGFPRSSVITSVTTSDENKKSKNKNKNENENNDINSLEQFTYPGPDAGPPVEQPRDKIRQSAI